MFWSYISLNMLRVILPFACLNDLGMMICWKSKLSPFISPDAITGWSFITQTISSDLSLQRHMSNVSATSFYWLRQLRRVRRSLDSESAATLVTHSWPPEWTSATPRCPEPRSRPLTPCSVLWTLPHASSVKQDSSTTAWLRSCMTTYTGWMWQIK